MRIALIAPLVESVPPTGYGGSELIVSLLATGLIQAGHDVTVFASGDSTVDARLEAIVMRNLRQAGVGGALKGPNLYIYHLANAVACLKRGAAFDLIHNHAWVETMLAGTLVETPMLTTIHNMVDDHAAFAFEHSSSYFNTISRSAFEHLPDPVKRHRHRYTGAVLHGIDYRSFPFSFRAQGYLLVLNRIHPEKGVHHAIEVARRLNRPLVIAGKVDPTEQAYFRKEVEPSIDGRWIRYVGEADARMKRDLYTGAVCLLNPICWPEPFGLVMIEAMACGTPVAAFRQGAAPEIIIHGETGGVVNTVDEMVEIVQRIDQIDRRACRRHVEQHFSCERMVAEYVAIYEQIVGSRLRILA